MKFHRHLLRDVFVLTLPIAALLVYLLAAAAMSFYRSEIACYHGYPVRAVRVGGLSAALDQAVAPLLGRDKERYRPSRDRLAARENGPRVYDLSVDGSELDELRSDLPGSAKEWVRGTLHEGGKFQRVDVRNRGQRMVNYFWRRKAWKIRTETRQLVDGYRYINLSPFENRLDGHLTFVAARHCNVPAPRSRIAQLYLNGHDEGLYVQEEQVDESMVRRHGRMPGDIFYGELFVPDEPTMSADDLFWNPFLWRKKAIHNYFGEEHRPYLTELIAQVASESADSHAKLFEILDRDAFVDYFAILTLQGDQHVDQSHNHKLYFSPISGRFEPILWNPLMNMPIGHGVESTANRLFRKVVRNPEFLDLVQRRVAEMVAAGAIRAQLEEIERLRQDVREYALDVDRFDRMLAGAESRLRARAETIAGFQGDEDVRFAVEPIRDLIALDVHARGPASLRLHALELEAMPNAEVELWEDRNFNGIVDGRDRQLALRREADRFDVDSECRLHCGRDQRASYLFTENGAESPALHRQFSRIAYLHSRLLIRNASDVESIDVRSGLSGSTVEAVRGAPDDYVSRSTAHPWRMPTPASPVAHRFSGTQRISQDLWIRPVDTLEIEPGSTIELGPGVSIVVQSRVEWRDVKFVRADARFAWGVIALQDRGASGSTIEDCRFYGGSHDVPGFIYYSGMLSVHEADDVTLRGCRFGPNLLGDDTVRFARCNGVHIVDVTIEDANGDAIDCDQCVGRIEGAQILRPRNDGIDLMTANVDVHRARVERAGDKGISFGESANPLVTDSELIGCILGVGLKDSSDPILRNVTIRECQVAIAGYDKNWRYPGGGRGRFIDCKLLGNDVEVRLDAASRVALVASQWSGIADLPTGADLSTHVEVLTLAEARARAIDDDRFRELFVEDGR